MKTTGKTQQIQTVTLRAMDHQMTQLNLKTMDNLIQFPLLPAIQEAATPCPLARLVTNPLPTQLMAPPRAKTLHPSTRMMASMFLNNLSPALDPLNLNLSPNPNLPLAHLSKTRVHQARGMETTLLRQTMLKGQLKGVVKMASLALIPKDPQGKLNLYLNPLPSLQPRTLILPTLMAKPGPMGQGTPKVHWVRTLKMVVLMHLVLALQNRLPPTQTVQLPPTTQPALAKIQGLLIHNHLQPAPLRGAKAQVNALSGLMAPQTVVLNPLPQLLRYLQHHKILCLRPAPRQIREIQTVQKGTELLRAQSPILLQLHRPLQLPILILVSRWVALWTALEIHQILKLQAKAMAKPVLTQTPVANAGL
ncbi:hypothetical protein ACJ41O_010013 [Fusarium nematophilum]